MRDVMLANKDIEVHKSYLYCYECLWEKGKKGLLSDFSM